MSSKWNCNCQEYLKKELEKLEPWQTNAKKKIEELLASEECVYKVLDKKNKTCWSKNNFQITIVYLRIL